MEGEIEVIDTESWHVVFVASNMREGDVNELLAVGTTPLRSLIHGFKKSDRCMTLMVDGIPAAIFGITPMGMLSGKGSPWLLGTEDIFKVSRKFLKGSKGIVQEWADRYKLLLNYVDVRNKQSIRWLEWLGFSIVAAVPIGVNGEMFHPFYIGDPNV